MSRGDSAYENFLKGYNCTQAVTVAFSDIFELDEEKLARISGGFGGGVGRMREVCGTFLGVVMILSEVYGYSEPKNLEAKKALYEKIRAAAEEFRKDNKSIICRELLGLEKPETSAEPEARTSEYYKKRPCPMLCKYAADLAERMISERNENL